MFVASRQILLFLSLSGSNKQQSYICFSIKFLFNCFFYHFLLINKRVPHIREKWRIFLSCSNLLAPICTKTYERLWPKITGYPKYRNCHETIFNKCSTCLSSFFLSAQRGICNCRTKDRNHGLVMKMFSVCIVFK